jgi:hypothetical protein
MSETECPPYSTCPEIICYLYLFAPKLDACVEVWNISDPQKSIEKPRHGGTRLGSQRKDMQEFGKDVNYS